MNYNELFELAQKGEITVGETFWIVDFRYSDPQNKPVRDIPPTEVQLFQNKEGYLSDFHFRPYGESGKLLARKIYPWENRSSNGYGSTSVGIFYTEAEAKEHYIYQCTLATNMVKREQLAVNYRFNTIAAELAARITEAQKV